MIATTISYGKVVSIEEIQLTFRTEQQSLIQSQHPKGESVAGYP